MCGQGGRSNLKPSSGSFSGGSGSLGRSWFPSDTNSAERRETSWRCTTVISAIAAVALLVRGALPPAVTVSDDDQPSRSTVRGHRRRCRRRPGERGRGEGREDQGRGRDRRRPEAHVGRRGRRRPRLRRRPASSGTSTSSAPAAPGITSRSTVRARSSGRTSRRPTTMTTATTPRPGGAGRRRAQNASTSAADRPPAAPPRAR